MSIVEYYQRDDFLSNFTRDDLIKICKEHNSSVGKVDSKNFLVSHCGVKLPLPIDTSTKNKQELFWSLISSGNLTSTDFSLNKYLLDDLIQASSCGSSDKFKAFINRHLLGDYLVEQIHYQCVEDTLIGGGEDIDDIDALCQSSLEMEFEVHTFGELADKMDTIPDIWIACLYLTIVDDSQLISETSLDLQLSHFIEYIDKVRV